MFNEPPIRGEVVEEVWPINMSLFIEGVLEPATEDTEWLFVRNEFVREDADSRPDEPIKLLFVGEAITVAVDVGDIPDGTASPVETVVDVFDADVMLEVAREGDIGLTAAASAATACW